MDLSSPGIRSRISDFLRNYPPFSFIKTELLDALSGQVRVRYLATGETVYNEGDSNHGVLYIVEKGSIRIASGQNIIDVCDEGDVFGADAVMALREYSTGAIADEDSMVMLLPWDAFAPIMENNPRVALFFAAGFAGAGKIRKRDSSAEKILVTETRDRLAALKEEDAMTFDLQKEVYGCSRNTPIREAAELMTRENVGSILIKGESGNPEGIVTDTDFRKKIATGKISIEEPVESIMSSPVYTIPADMPVATIILHMMNRGIHHLCVTEDGSVNSKAIGIVSEHDVLLLHGNNPAVLVKEIRQSRNTERLVSIRQRGDDLIRHYLDQGISMSFITSINAEISDALIHRAINLSVEKLEAEEGLKAPVDWVWLSLGSEGRREQILPTDQDNALLFADPEPEKLEETRNYFLKLGAAVTGILEAAGFEKCPSDMMASNPRWCLSLNEWVNTFAQWIQVPEPKSLMHSTIFFDFRPIHGQESLATELRNQIEELMKREKLFLPYLARNALLNPPPLSFFRGFIMERSGEHRNRFDIKLRAMMPIADAARVLMLDLGIRNAYSTVERLKQIGIVDHTLKEITEEAADAYEIMMRFRARSGFQNKDSGRYLEPEAIGKIDRQTLRNSFHAISEFQTVLRMRYNLDYLG